MARKKAPRSVPDPSTESPPVEFEVVNPDVKFDDSQIRLLAEFLLHVREKRQQAATAVNVPDKPPQ
jgi:hypothetical protein